MLKQRGDIPPPPVILRPRNEDIYRPPKGWDGTIYVSNLPKDGDREGGEYVEDIFNCYCYVKRIHLYTDKSLKWNGCALIILDDIQIKERLVKEGLYIYEHKEFKCSRIEHHPPVIWYEVLFNEYIKTNKC